MILERFLVLVNLKLHYGEVDGLTEARHMVYCAQLVCEGENHLDDLIFVVEKVEVGERRVVEEKRQLDGLPFLNL